MAFAELDGVRALHQIQAAHNSISDDFLRHTEVLDRIRAAIYQSGSDVREYVLEPDPQKTRENRASISHRRAELAAQIDEYRQLLKPGERPLFAALEREVTDYWASINPLLDWTDAHRAQAGYVFLRDDVFPRRTTLLAITDQVGAAEARQLSEDKRLVEASYWRFRNRLTIVIGLTIGLGLLLAAFTIWQVLGPLARLGTGYRQTASALPVRSAPRRS